MAKIPIKYLPITGILLLLFALGFFLLKAGHKGINSTVVNEVSSDASVAGEKIHVTQDNPDEGTKWVLDADEPIYSKDKQYISFKNFQLKFEPLNGASLEITGNKGDYDINSKEIRLQGNLQGDSSNGYKIFTEYLIYQQKEGVLKTDELVKITGPFFSTTGRGLLSYPEKGTLKIISDVKTLI